MKSLIVIGLAVLISGLGAVSYVNAAINHDIAQFHVKELKVPYNPQETIDGEVLQPAAHVQPNFTTTFNPQQSAPASVLTTSRIQ
jgi:hypothetical protein